MKIELGALIILVEGVDELWHVPAPLVGNVRLDGLGARAALCGLGGLVYAFAGPIRERRLCAVCRGRAPAEIAIPELGPLPQRGGRHELTGRLSRAHLRVLYRLYQEDGLGTYRLAQMVWQQLGYTSIHSCAQAIWNGFTRMGFELRSQSEATVLWNYKHGRKTRAVLSGTAAEREYRRWLKEQRGEYRPTCDGVRTQRPGKGKRCTRPAMAGSDYCWSHDPSVVDARNAQLAAMRDRRVELERLEAAA